MGYLNHDGCNSDLLLRSLATAIHFPPLIASINRIIDRNNVIGRDIVCVTSTLYTYFKSYLIPNIFSTYVFDFSLHMCNLIVNSYIIPDEIPLRKITTKSNESIISKININFATPQYIISKNVDSLMPNQRLKRILKELFLANEVTNSKSKFYDEDLKVLTCCDQVDVWMVFIKGCEGTPYENK